MNPRSYLVPECQDDRGPSTSVLVFKDVRKIGSASANFPSMITGSPPGSMRIVNVCGCPRPLSRTEAVPRFDQEGLGLVSFPLLLVQHGQIIDSPKRLDMVASSRSRRNPSSASPSWVRPDPVCPAPDRIWARVMIAERVSGCPSPSNCFQPSRAWINSASAFDGSSEPMYNSPRDLIVSSVARFASPRILRYSSRARSRWSVAAGTRPSFE